MGEKKLSQISESMLGWMAFVFGCILFLSPDVKSFALMSRAAPLSLWGFVFWALGVVTIWGQQVEAWGFRMIGAGIGVLCWGAILATYSYELSAARTIYPTQGMALVCFVHAAWFAGLLWRTR